MLKKIIQKIRLWKSKQETIDEDLDININDSQNLETNSNNKNIDGLAPANLIEAFLPLNMFTGKPLNILINEKYDFGDMKEFPLQKMNVLMILLMMEKMLNSGKVVGTILVSDGLTSHALSPIRVTQEKSYRLYFKDPWGEESFLEEGKNIASVSAIKENDGLFSISYNEYESVIVAFGFVTMDTA